MSQHLALLTPQKHIHSQAQSFVIPIDGIKPLLKLMVAEGIPLPELLANTQLSFAQLMQPKGNIRIEQFLTLIANSRTLTQQPDYALKLGEQFFINYDGVLARRVMCSQNGLEAMQLLIHYQPLFTQVLTLDFVVIDGKGIFSVKPRIPLGNAFDHFVEYAFSALYGLGRFCLGQAHLSIEFEFSQHEHAQKNAFTRYLSNPVRFDSPQDRAILSAEVLATPCIFKQAEIALENEAICQRYLKHIQGDSDTLMQVRNTMRNTAFNKLSLEYVAQKLFMSPRSLRRHLNQQASSFSLLLEEERKRIAEHKLLHSEASLDQIAEYLGYHSGGSFSRAFKRWHGISPAHFRQGTLPTSST